MARNAQPVQSDLEGEGRVSVRDVLWLLVSGGLVVLGVVPLIAPEWYLTAMLATLAPQIAMAGGVLLVLSLVRRRLAPTLLVAVGCGVMVIAWVAAPRADRVEAAGSGDAVVRVMVINAAGTRVAPDAAMSLMVSEDPDVVALTEPSSQLLDAIRASDELSARLPGRWLPDHAEGGFRVVLSRWAQRGRDGAGGFGLGAQATLVDGRREALVLHPEAPFAFVQVHPLSPRSLERWRSGNATLRGAAGFIEGSRRAGLPVVLAGDLNSSPTSLRSRIVHDELGLSRATGVMDHGTFPAAFPGPLRFSLDDVAVSPDVRVVGWRSVRLRGSDHRAIIATLAVPHGAIDPALTGEGGDAAGDQPAPSAGGAGDGSGSGSPQSP